MSKKVLIISTSVRANSNSEALANAFAEGAREAGNEVEMVSLRGKSLAFCRGCLACKKLGRCAIQDDANSIIEKLMNAEVVVWATPIYYYQMSGQMKTMMDRANALYPESYKFRDVYLLSTATEDGLHVDEGAVKGLNCWIACFERARFAGKVFAGGIEDPGAIAGHKALAEARSMGRTIA